VKAAGRSSPLRLYKPRSNPIWGGATMIYFPLIHASRISYIYHSTKEPLVKSIVGH
jgi:hypothetical protein